jgi:hypothetical protein
MRYQNDSRRSGGVLRDLSTLVSYHSDGPSEWIHSDRPLEF